MFLKAPRLEMGRLAVELGISKATLYRWTGSREQLLTEVLTYASQKTFADALSRTEHLRGADRALILMRNYLELVVAAEPLRVFIRNETRLAFRLLTTRGGAVQRDAIRMVSDLLAHEQEANGMKLSAPPDTLAYAIVRMSEGFIYVDPFADVEPDIDAAIQVASLLIK
jgi:AcrR family transcriptional regulator